MAAWEAAIHQRASAEARVARQARLMEAGLPMLTIAG
jgi:hypothetical protein